MATFIFFDEFKNKVGSKVINLSATDVFKWYLTNATPAAATHDEKADLAGITEENGYTEYTMTNAWAETAGGSGIWRFAGSEDIVWTASLGNFGPFRYAVLYDDTVAGDPLVGYVDFGSSDSVTTGTPEGTATLNLDADFAIFTLDG
jgi:hypothetical protein